MKAKRKQSLIRINDAEETKPCPQCGMLMILCDSGMTLQCYPPIHLQEWWCKCGHTEEAPRKREKTREELLGERWARVQKRAGGAQ